MDKTIAEQDEWSWGSLSELERVMAYYGGGVTPAEKGDGEQRFGGCHRCRVALARADEIFPRLDVALAGRIGRRLRRHRRVRSEKGCARIAAQLDRRRRARGQPSRPR